MRNLLLFSLAVPLLLWGCKDDEVTPTNPNFENLSFSHAKAYYYGDTGAAADYYEIILYTGTIDEKDVLTSEGQQLKLCLYSQEELKSGKYAVGSPKGDEFTYLPGSSAGGTKFRIKDSEDRTYNITGGELTVTASGNSISSLTFNFTSDNVIIGGAHSRSIEIKDLTEDPEDPEENKIEDITFTNAYGYYYGKEEGSSDPDYYELFFYTGELDENEELSGQGNLLRLCVYSGEELSEGTYTAGNGSATGMTFVPGSTDTGTKFNIRDEEGNTVYFVTGGSAEISRPTGTSIELEFEFSTATDWELSGTFSGSINIIDRSPQKPPIEDPQPEGFTKFNYIFAHYYGDDRDTGTGMFRIVLCDIDSERYANESIWLVGFCELSDDPDNFELPVGTYSMDTSLTGDPFTVWPGTKDNLTGYLDNTYYYFRQGSKRNYLADGGTVTVSKEEEYYTIMVELETYRTLNPVERKDDIKYYYFGEIEFENNVLIPDPEYYQPEELTDMVLVSGGDFAGYGHLYKTEGVMPLDIIFQGPVVNGILDEVIFNVSVPPYEEDYGDIQSLLPAGTYSADTEHATAEAFRYLPGRAQGALVNFSRYVRRLGSSTVDIYIAASLEEGELTISYPNGESMRIQGVFTGNNPLTGQTTTTEVDFEVGISSLIVDVFYF